MEELLDRLEKQIRELTGQRHQLKQDSQQLQQNEHVLAREKAEKALLLSRQQKAINQIESLISRLKTIEKTS